MTKPKTLFTPELAIRAQADMKNLGWRKVALKLTAIAAAEKYPVAMVAEVFDVDKTTIWRWGRDYDKWGLDGIWEIPKSPTPEQEAVMRSWLETYYENTWSLLSFAEWERDLDLHFGIDTDTFNIIAWLRRNGCKGIPSSLC